MTSIVQCMSLKRKMIIGGEHMFKKIIILLVILLLSMIIFDRPIKNLTGSFLAYGHCPNCHDSWWWKPIENVNYKSGSDVMICKECLQIPKDLDLQKIKSNLIKWKWEKENINKVIIALNKLK